MKILLLFLVSLFTAAAGQSEAETYFDPDIKEIEENITAKLYGPLDRVLVCLNQDARNQFITDRYIDLRPCLDFEFPGVNIEYHDVGSCHTEIEKDERQRKTIVAVVAPKPFKLSSDIPMYFYDIPSRDPEIQEDIEAFPNGLAHIQKDHWKWLKHAFTQHINSNGWKRIAIVSDYSYYSEKFETVLVEHFKENAFVYNVQRCVVVDTPDDCDFTSTLKFLETNKAVIIIANVEGRNAQNLANVARAQLMNSEQYVWLVRDWPFQEPTAQKFKHILSISLSPKYWLKHSQEYHDGPHLNSIRHGLQLICEAIRVTEKKDRIDKYYKSFTQEMKMTQYNEYTGYIRKFTPDRPKIIKTLTIESTGVTEVVVFGQEPDKIADFGEHCMFRSKSFTSPCNDNWVMLICFVWLMFILMTFLLVFFFNRCLVWT